MLTGTLETNEEVVSPLIGSEGGMGGDSRDRLPCPSVLFCFSPPSWFPSVPRHGAGPFGPVAAVGVVLAPTAPDPALRLADALAAAEPVDHVLGDGVVEALPVLLGDEDSGKHSGM